MYLLFLDLRFKTLCMGEARVQIWFSGIRGCT